MKKRAYVLVYVLVIMAILFFIVVRLTDTSIEKSDLQTSLKDSLANRYAYESAGHYAIDYARREGLLDLEQQASRQTRQSIEIDPRILDERAILEAKGEDLVITIGDGHSDYQTHIRFSKDTKSLLENDGELLEGLIRKGLSESYSSQILKLDDCKVGQDDYGLYYIEEGKGLDQADEDLSIGLSQAGADKLLKDIEIPSIDELESEASDETNQEDEINLIPIDPNDEEKGGLDNNLELENEDQSDKEEEEIQEKIYISKDKILILGENVSYVKDEPIEIFGVLTMGENTRIEGELVHKGILIFDARPNIEGKVYSLGGLIGKRADLKKVQGLKFFVNEEEITRIVKIFNNYDSYYGYRLKEFVIK